MFWNLIKMSLTKLIENIQILSIASGKPNLKTLGTIISYSGCIHVHHSILGIEGN